MGRPEYLLAEIDEDAKQTYPQGGRAGERTIRVLETRQDHPHFRSNKQVKTVLSSLSSYRMRGLGVRDNK